MLLELTMHTQSLVYLFLTESGVFTSGTTDAVQVALQGTGAFTAASDFGTGSTGVTSSLLADFDQNPA